MWVPRSRRWAPSLLYTSLDSSLPQLLHPQRTATLTGRSAAAHSHGLVNMLKQISNMSGEQRSLSCLPEPATRHPSLKRPMPYKGPALRYRNTCRYDIVRVMCNDGRLLCIIRRTRLVISACRRASPRRGTVLPTPSYYDPSPGSRDGVDHAVRAAHELSDCCVQLTAKTYRARSAPIPDSSSNTTMRT